jgi:NAD(P)-dependent dehydrogenase (short-subunit alcohol dehydrogenase family)
VARFSNAIRANIISPGTIDTPILALLSKEAMAQIVASIPMGRMGSAD